jgi:hypothetical protein
VKSTTLTLAVAALAACSANPRPAPAQRAAPAPALAVAPLAGQRVPVLPLTLITADGLAADALPAGREARLAWADSVVAEVLRERAPEVTWVLPPELRAAARRAPATVTDPDRMGQALLRAEGIEVVPDPLRSYLRALTAITNARMVLVPAAARFTPDSTGAIRVEAVMVLADSRNGAIVWRSHPVHSAPTAAEALGGALRRLLPDFQ